MGDRHQRLSLAQAAVVLGCDENEVRVLIRQGRLRVEYGLAGLVYVRRGDLDALMQLAGQTSLDDFLGPDFRGVGASSNAVLSWREQRTLEGTEIVDPPSV